MAGGIGGILGSRAKVYDAEKPSTGFAEVELMCSLNDGGELTAELQRSPLASVRPARTTQAAILACLGSAAARAQVMGALDSSDDKEVQVAQVYLRHHPLTDTDLREVAAGITRMTDSRAQILVASASGDRKSTRLNSSHMVQSRMPSSA